MTGDSGGGLMACTDHDISYEIDNEAQFWQEIEDIVQPLSSTQEAITNAVSNYITFVSQFGAEYLTTDADVELCCFKLLGSDFHNEHAEQVREALISYKPELDKIAKCYINLYLLLLDGQDNPKTFKLIKRANMVPVIAKLAKDNHVESLRFTRLALTILYEICRETKLAESDLYCFDEEFIWFLFRSIEQARDDEDPYSYRCIKVIISLNEQFMVAALPQTPTRADSAPQNSVMKVLSDHGSRFRAFGENLIRMLNRERDTALQLLILKQLFLLFTNAPTYEYIYTNDLHVLVDVFIRELYNLPTEAESLRHTYLRVLHPLLTHTQLRHESYKGPELVVLLNSLNQECSHFGPVGTTTVRLLARCLTVPWLLPPRRRKLKLPTIPIERKKSAKNLGMSLDQAEVASVASLKSIESVNSIAKVRPPTKPRLKPAPKGSQTPERPALPTVRESSKGKFDTVAVANTEMASAKTDDLLREMNKLQVSV